MDGWMDGWIDEWTDGWMDRWMDGWTDGWIDESMNPHITYIPWLGIPLISVTMVVILLSPHNLEYVIFPRYVAGIIAT